MKTNKLNRSTSGSLQMGANIFDDAERFMATGAVHGTADTGHIDPGLPTMATQRTAEAPWAGAMTSEFCALETAIRARNNLKQEELLQHLSQALGIMVHDGIVAAERAVVANELVSGVSAPCDRDSRSKSIGTSEVNDV